MPSHTETRIVPYSAEQLFDLVMDIEKYPEFLPWCTGARVRSRAKDKVEADVIIGYKLFQERFSSRVHFTRPKSVEVEYMQGPMRHLHNTWSFKDVKAGQCRVEFHVDFVMSSRLFEKIVDQFFHRVLARMIDAFEARALELYGGRKH
jgi:coenzyme Q-binding protein COQ10